MKRNFGAMNNGIIDEIRESFRKGSTLTKLIYINLGVFIAVKLAAVFYTLFVPTNEGLQIMTKSQMFKLDYLKYLMLSSDLSTLLYRPWTFITYMFLHFDFLHILFNLLILFWFGQIFLQYLSEKQLVTTYLLGGITGAVFYLLFYNSFPGLQEYVGAPMLGASAGVMAIVLAISFYNPKYTIRLFFIGEVQLKYVAIVYVVLDVLQIAGDNSGGHIAHLGGALYGYLFAMQMKKGKDTGKGFSRYLDYFFSIFKRQPKMKVAYKNKAKGMNDQDYNQAKAATQVEVDRILDKIAKTGYESLSKSEKETLFKMSDKR